jgi:hypothetical protein
MALADFFDRTAVAASQILLGYDDAAFRRLVGTTAVGLAFGPELTENEGRHAADMAIRLLARLYPTIVLYAAPGAEAFADVLGDLARSINPKIDVARAGATAKTIVFGKLASLPSTATSLVYAGSNGWDALVSLTGALQFGGSSNPFGAGAAAAIACADVFATIFGGTSPCGPSDLTLSTLEGAPRATALRRQASEVEFAGAVLIGLGAIGNAVIWALSRSGARGEIHVVDDEPVDLSNLQRYVLAEHNDIAEPKTVVALHHLGGSLRGVPHPQDFATFTATEGYRWDQAIVALDSADGRRSVQASLPRRIVNAWTQLEDLGVSNHGTFGGPGACLACLYLPRDVVPSDHEVVAAALRIPDRVTEVKDLLHNGQPVPDDMLAMIVENFAIVDADIEMFRGKPIRELYSRGLCGGALIPLEAVGQTTRRRMHVPVAHQSALAGILLGAAAIRQAVAGDSDETLQTRIDLRTRLSPYLTLPVLADETGRCICRDRLYVATYREKYGPTKAYAPLLHANGQF